MKWALIGTVTSIVLLIAQTSAMGGVTGLLQVGEESALRPTIEGQLGTVPLAPGPGHDGQIYYAIGLDPTGKVVPEMLDHASYRYRRILYPLTASVFGLLEGRALLYGMIVVSVASTAIAAGGVAGIASRRGRSDWLALAVVLNPGVWLSVRLLTGDNLALALMIAGLYYMSEHKQGSAAAFTLSVLAKEAYLVTPFGIGASRYRTRSIFALWPLLALATWIFWLQADMGGALSPRGNVTLPLDGLMESARIWPTLDGIEWFYLAFALGSVALGLVNGTSRPSFLRMPILIWSILGVVSSSWVWDLGNNAARVFAPIVVLVAVSYASAGRRVPAEGESETAEIVA